MANGNSSSKSSQGSGASTRNYTDQAFIVKLSGFAEDGSRIEDFLYFPVKVGQDPAEVVSFANNTGFKRRKTEGWANHFVYRSFLERYTKHEDGTASFETRDPEYQSSLPLPQLQTA